MCILCDARTCDHVITDMCPVYHVMHRTGKGLKSHGLLRAQMMLPIRFDLSRSHIGALLFSQGRTVAMLQDK